MAVNEPLSEQQRRDLELVALGFISTAMLNRVKTLARKGLVTDLGLYDRGSDRYKISSAGRAALAGESDEIGRAVSR